MKATCRCGLCGLRWFRCTCVDMAVERMAPESTWPFWRNMTTADVEAYMDRAALYEAMKQQLARAKGSCWFV